MDGLDGSLGGELTGALVGPDELLEIVHARKVGSWPLGSLAVSCPLVYISYNAYHVDRA